MTEEYRCQHCDQPFGITPEMHGTKVACPHCKKPVLIQKANQPVPPAPRQTQVQKGQATAQVPSPPPAPPAFKNPETKENGTSSTNDLMPPVRKNLQNAAGSEFKSDLTPPAFKPAKPAAKQISGGANQDLSPPEFPAKKKTSAGPIKESAEFASPSDQKPPQVPENDHKQAQAEDGEQLDDSSERESNHEKLSGSTLTQQEVIEQLLPPKFLVGEPGAQVQASTGMVLIPDSAGGYKEVDETIATIEHGGKKIKLRTYTKEELTRRRRIFGAAVFVFCLLILVLAFWILRQMTES